MQVLWPTTLSIWTCQVAKQGRQNMGPLPPAACSPCAAAAAEGGAVACCCGGGAACCGAAAASACWAALAREVSIAPQSVGAAGTAPAASPAGPWWVAPDGITKSGGGGGSSLSISVSSSCKRACVTKKCRRIWHSSPHLAKCQKGLKEAEGSYDLAVFKNHLCFATCGLPLCSGSGGCAACRHA